MDNGFRSAPDFTNACVVMFGVNLSWILFAIWSIWGLLMAILFSWAINHTMTWLHARAVVRQERSIKRGKRG